MSVLALKFKLNLARSEFELAIVFINKKFYSFIDLVTVMAKSVLLELVIRKLAPLARLL